MEYEHTEDEWNKWFEWNLKSKTFLDEAVFEKKLIQLLKSIHIVSFAGTNLVVMKKI